MRPWGCNGSRFPFSRASNRSPSRHHNIEFGPPDAIYVGGAGVVALVFNNNEVQNVTRSPAQTLPIAGVKRVNSTNTTATVMNALYAT